MIVHNKLKKRKMRFIVRLLCLGDCWKKGVQCFQGLYKTCIGAFWYSFIYLLIILVDHKSNQLPIDMIRNPSFEPSVTCAWLFSNPPSALKFLSAVEVFFLLVKFKFFDHPESNRLVLLLIIKKKSVYSFKWIHFQVDCYCL